MAIPGLILTNPQTTMNTTPNLPQSYYGTEGADTFLGSDGNSFILGNGGNDYLSGNGGIDTIYGGKGNDRLYGGLEDDWLKGEEGNDYLYGGSHDDNLMGGTGKDFLTGGDGFDNFIFTTSTSGGRFSSDSYATGISADVIRDFDEDQDAILFWDEDVGFNRNDMRYTEMGTSAKSLDKAVAQANSYNKPIGDDFDYDVMFMYSTTGKNGFVLWDADRDGSYDTGVILAGANSADSFSQLNVGDRSWLNM